jgi:Mg2+ and Co2+ transporter CorA
MTPVEKIRHEIAELEADIADHLQADQFIDGRRFGNERLDGMRQALSFARGRLIIQAVFTDLLTDVERDAWLLSRAGSARHYMTARLQLARDASQIAALRRRTISAETQLAGAKAQIALLVSAAQKALAGDTEALLREIKRAAP